MSPDGTQTWIAYHAKDTAAYTYEARTTRVQRGTRTADGTPYAGRPVSLVAPQPLPSGDPRPGG